MSLPNAPTNVVATVPPGFWPTINYGTLTWTDNTGGVCGHHIYRRHIGSNGPTEADHLYATVDPGITSFLDTGPLLPQNRYTYYVRSFNDEGESERPLPATSDEVYMMVHPQDQG
jgi:hypothetical protein